MIFVQRQDYKLAEFVEAHFTDRHGGTYLRIWDFMGMSSILTEQRNSVQQNALLTA